MSLAALELNDHALLIQADDGSLHAEPGFARLAPEGLVTGEAALAVAWREPQHVHNQYWCHLNQTPLVASSKWARHHADIAFAQLRQLWREAGEPERLILLAPGSFTDAQLSLLLGMVEALGARAVAVIDSALAHCLEARQATLQVELQLHQAVLTVCRPRGATLAIVDQEVFPGLGLTQIHNSVARRISDLMIDSYRFDPLHTSASEQAIYDRIPAWLSRLAWEEEISTTLATDKGDLPCILRADDVRQLVGERLVSVRSFLARHHDCALLLSHSAAPLAGLAEEFREARVAGQSAATELCLAHQGLLLGQGEELYRLREVERGELAPEPAPAVNGEAATHVLYRDRALALSRPLSIRVADAGLELSRALDADASLTLALRGGALETLHRARDTDAELPAHCEPGAHIRVGGHELTLIRVRDD